MEQGKYIKYALRVMLALWLASGLGSCDRDEFGGNPETGYGAVTINVRMPAPDIVRPTSRAAASDFDRMSDMNILVAEGGAAGYRILDRIYFRFEDVTEGQVIGGTTITYQDVEENGENIRQFRLVFSNDYFSSIDGIDLRTCRFYAVANWGSGIDATTVDELKKLKAPSRSDAPGIVPYPNVMYGISMDNGFTPIDGEPGMVQRNLSIPLVRTAAMVTLAMDGGGLDEGVVITPKHISLHNVPTSCVLGSDNSVTTAPGGIEPKNGAVTPDGESVNGAVWSAGYSLTGTATASWNGFGDGSIYKTDIGKHYNSYDAPDVSDESVLPLFLYENIHGAAFGADETNQVYKRPAAAVGNSEAQINDVAAACSYIEVEAEYTRFNRDMSVAQKGPVKWRFFLGKDVTGDFDVRRNTNYKVTLLLTGTGIGEGNASWRVDCDDLKKPEVVGEENMVVGGGGEMFNVEFINEQNQNMKLTTQGGDFVYAYAALDGSGKSYQWVPMSEAGNKAYKWYVTADKQMWFYVKPFLPGDSDTRTERTCTITFTKTDGTPLATVTFTQYKPLTVTVTNEDVSDTESRDMQEVKRLIETYYKYDFETAAEPFTFYIDRMDRNAMPWGFGGVPIDHNDYCGFENVYHLIDPQPYSPVCDVHLEAAMNYLPTGKGYKDPVTGYIDWSNGSCMMQAAMENYFQQYYPKPDNSLSPDDLLLMDRLPDRPQISGDPSGARVYGWCVPSIVGWQMVEKIDRYNREKKGGSIFDPEHPILNWTSYWTSNHGTSDMQDEYPQADGKTRAFVYQFDMGLDMIKEGEHYPGYLLLPRGTSLKYRLFNIRPQHIK